MAPRIAFVSDRDTMEPFDTEIYIMDADGSNPQRITEKTGMEWGIDWRPVGEEETSPNQNTIQ
jgi:Tol biopolymer transport system component